MSAARSSSKTPKGLSFSVADHLLVTAWSQARAFTVVVQLDFGADVEEYEEAFAFHSGQNSACRWIMWRDKEKVWIQPLIGRPQPYDSVADAIDFIDAKTVAVQSIVSPTPRKSFQLDVSGSLPSEQPLRRNRYIGS